MPGYSASAVIKPSRIAAPAIDSSTPAILVSRERRGAALDPRPVRPGWGAACVMWRFGMVRAAISCSFGFGSSIPLSLSGEETGSQSRMSVTSRGLRLWRSNPEGTRRVWRPERSGCGNRDAGGTVELRELAGDEEPDLLGDVHGMVGGPLQLPSGVVQVHHPCQLVQRLTSAASGNVCLVAAGTGTERVWWEDGFPLAMLLACSFSLCPCGPHELVARRSLVADRLECWLRRGRPHHGGRHAAALAAEPRPRLAGRPGAGTLSGPRAR